MMVITTPSSFSNPKSGKVIRSRSYDRQKVTNSPTISTSSSMKFEKIANTPSVSSRNSRGSESGSIEKLNVVTRKIMTSFPQVEDNIRVVVRVRPLNAKENRSGDVSTVKFPGNGQLIVKEGQKEKFFSFDAIFEPAATQEDVFENCGVKTLIEMAIEGFRSTIFCYGQTGSGKTHTLTGPPEIFLQSPPPLNNKNHGLIFRSFSYLFQTIDKKSEMNYNLKTSFLEIYNEKIIDLLNPGSSRKPLPIRWSKKTRGFVVENLFTVVCDEFDDLVSVLEEGLKNRSVGKHNMNEYSSRSHTILTINITSEQATDGGVFISRTGKLNFVDLAGSEITKKTQSGGKTLEEANNINKSLMVLGYCISSLSDLKRKGNHIPYRDSNLTKLLADSLSGNGVTLMIACISPAKSNQAESLNTLRYAARAKKIRTKPSVLMDPREALILNLKLEISTLQTENEHLKSALNIDHSSVNSERLRLNNLEKVSELENPELVELVRIYANENENLKKTNEDLFESRELLLRDHELVCRENERLLKKLEDVNSSPLIPARPAFSAGDLDTSIVSNSENSTTPSSTRQSSGNVPTNINKELDLRQLGKVNISARSRRECWSGKNHPLRAKSLKSSEANSRDSSKTRRFSLAPDNQLVKNLHLFGSKVSLSDDPD